MKPKKKQENIDPKKEHLIRVGKRIKEIRLAEGGIQHKLEEELGIASLSFNRIEFGKGGALTSFIAILQYFSDLGYNLKWILEFDNSNELKKKDQIYTFDINKDEIKKSTTKLTKEITNLTKLIDKI